MRAVLDQVVDDERVDGPAGEGSADTGGGDAAFVAVELPLVLGGEVVLDTQVQVVGVDGDVVADRAGPHRRASPAP